LGRVHALFKRHSFIGSVVVYTGLYGGGDVARQVIQQVPTKDYVTSARMSAVGGGVMAPVFYGWYKFLDRYMFGSSMKLVIKKVIIDQAIAGSLSVLLFYVAMSVLERKQNKFQELQEKGVKTYMTGCVYWPIVQTINFRYAPPYARTAFVASAGFIWCIILSYIKSLQPTSKSGTDTNLTAVDAVNQLKLGGKQEYH
jgi:hypothetical protein